MNLCRLSVQHNRLLFWTIITFTSLSILVVVNQTYETPFSHVLPVLPTWTAVNQNPPSDEDKQAAQQDFGSDAGMNASHTNSTNIDISDPPFNQTEGMLIGLSPDTPKTSPWIFNATRDERAYVLTKDQCNAAFPNFSMEIHRAAEYRRRVGSISPEDVDISWKRDGAVIGVIVDQQLYILEAKFSGDGYDSVRGLAVLHSIHRALITSPTPIPNIEFSFSVSDVADPTNLGRSIWALSRTKEKEEKWLLPDFGYWSWPVDLIGGYDQVRREIANSELAFSLKKKQVVWRGALKTNALRKDLIRVTRNKDWADVQAIEWHNSTTVAVASNSITIPDHCQYQFVIQTEGRSYSGRGKYLQNCNSVVIMHRRTWIEPYHHLLIPSGPLQNFVEVETDFSDLEEKILSLLQNPARAERIAKNSIDTFRDRYLTPAAQACYWRELMRSWAEVSFTPEVWEFDSSSGEKKTRGIPFESFV